MSALFKDRTSIIPSNPSPSLSERAGEREEQ